MEQSFFQKLKRVKFFDLLNLFFFIVAIPFAVVIKLRHKNIWLFSDCPNEARDNAYWLFRFSSKQLDHPELLFALKKTSPDYTKVKQYGRVIEYGSFFHWVYYLAAKNVISSQKACGPNPTICYLLDRLRLMHFNKVFLQHGIIKDDISFLYYKYTNIRLFTCSTKREYDYVKKHYGYPSQNVKLLGLCRFDNLHSFTKQDNLILIMPTWRKWLSHPTGKYTYKDLHTLFLQSDYYDKWNKFLNNPNLGKTLVANNLKAVFYLHREAQKYTDYFKSSSPNVFIMRFPEDDVQDLLKKASVLITDYSSVAMDFAYMGKALIYYQFDQLEFRNKHLPEGYFNYENDGFGPVVTYENQLLEKLQILIDNSWKDDEIYKKRRKDFFTLNDDNNCLRTYEAIKKI